MPTASNGSKAKAAKPKARKPRAATTPPPAPSPTERARDLAQTAVDLPLGAVLEVSDRVTELVEPFTDRAGAERELRSYRERLKRTAKRTERRGASARRKATGEVRKTRNRVEREARRRRRELERQLKRNRTEVEERVRKAIEEQRSRAQELVGQVGDQFSSLR